MFEMLKQIHSYLLSLLVSWPAVEKNIGPLLSKEFVSAIEGITGESLMGKRGPVKESVVDAISKMWCSEMNGVPGLIEFIKPFVRVKDIRINENGDFINQDMMEEFDEHIAGQFALLGVQCAAYSCRNLQFGKLKNIIINASRTAMNGDAIERYFVALPSDMYELFDDTFNSYDVEADVKGSIGKLRQPKPLFKVTVGPDGTPVNGIQEGYYYKCPCGREDFKLGSNGKDYTVNCYNCHMCYEHAEGVPRGAGKMYVFVKAHGTEKKFLGSDREKFIMDTIGVSEHYLQNKATKEEKDANAQQGQKGLSEGVEMEDRSFMQSMEHEAVSTIVNNAINSMTEHFKSLEDKQSQFNEIFERLNNVII